MEEYKLLTKRQSRSVMLEQKFHLAHRLCIPAYLSVVGETSSG